MYVVISIRLQPDTNYSKYLQQKVSNAVIMSFLSGPYLLHG